MSASSFDSEGFELRFQSLSIADEAYSFPCDVSGNVDLDSLSERERCRYLYARAVVGREFMWPQKRRLHAEPVQEMSHHSKGAA